LSYIKVSTDTRYSKEYQSFYWHKIY
jgi:hypothetical protein